MTYHDSLIAYYAHPMALYDTAVERADIRTLRKLGFSVVNPGSRKPLATMEDYVKLACSCDLVAFRAFDDGKLGSGVAIEIEGARKAGLPVIELDPFLSGRVLTRNQTRERMDLPPLCCPEIAPLRTLRDDPDYMSGDQYTHDQDWGAS